MYMEKNTNQKLPERAACKQRPEDGGCQERRAPKEGEKLNGERREGGERRRDRTERNGRMRKGNEERKTIQYKDMVNKRKREREREGKEQDNAELNRPRKQLRTRRKLLI